jgi:hypothetical protein
MFLLELLLALLVCQGCLLIPPGLALLHLGRVTLSFLQTAQGSGMNSIQHGQS